MNEKALMRSTVLELPFGVRGKVRDVYDLSDALLVVATDRISRFDVVLPTPIPGKGRVLTQMSRFWFEKLGGIVPHHYLFEPKTRIYRPRQVCTGPTINHYVPIEGRA